MGSTDMRQGRLRVREIVTVKTNNVIIEKNYPPPALLIPTPNPPETINALYHPKHHQRRVNFQLPHTHINRDAQLLS